MVHDDRIRLCRHRCVQQRLTRRHATDQPPNLSATLNLQPVGAVIAKARHVQQLVDVVYEFLERYRHEGIPGFLRFRGCGQTGHHIQ